MNDSLRCSLSITKSEYLADYKKLDYVDLATWLQSNRNLFPVLPNKISWAKVIGRVVADYALDNNEDLIRVRGAMGYIYPKKLLAAFLKEFLNSPVYLKHMKDYERDRLQKGDKVMNNEVIATAEEKSDDAVAPWSVVSDAPVIAAVVPVESIPGSVSMPSLLTEEEVSAYFRIPLERVVALRNSGEIPYRSLFGVIRYDPDIISQLGK